MTSLTMKHCVPCEGGLPPLTPDEVKHFLVEVPEWDVTDDEITRIGRTYEFDTFEQAIDFVNLVAEVAEKEDHHPDIHVNYSKVTLELWTHAIGGLSENDFILAAKVDELLKE